MPKEEKAASLKCALASSRRIRQFSTREIRTFEAGDVVELPHEEALYLIAGGQADGADDAAKTAKGVADGAAASKKSKEKKAD